MIRKQNRQLQITDPLYEYLLQPLLDVIQHVHGDRSDHGDLLGIILEDEDHVKVLEAELDTLEMNKFDILECGDERRPGGKVNLYKTYYNNSLDFDDFPILTKQLEVGCSRQVSRCGTP